MKISSITIPDGELGLKGTTLSGLGNIVLLAGSNGSGKSRLLSLVENFGRKTLSAIEKNVLKVNISRIEGDITAVEQAIEGYKLENTPDALGRWGSLKPTLEYRTKELQQLRQQLADTELIVMEHPGDKPTVVTYGARDTDLRDWKELRFQEVIDCYDSIKSEFNVNLIRESGSPAVKELINQYVHSKHKDPNSEEALSLEARIGILRDLLHDFLGAELDWDKAGDPMLFGFPISKANLSQGQKVLLKIALSLFFQDGSKEELVLLMDEPENHLHPLALTRLIDRIRSKCPKAQIWIATHSIHLLAHFGSESIWFVKDGAVSYAGSKSLEVLEDLVGDESRLGELASFIALPEQHAAINFASQCLFPPKVLDTPYGDPQNGQIYAVIKRLLEKSGSLRLVDFGMGTGRLLSELSHRFEQEAASLSEKIDYRGLDEYASTDNESLCRARLAGIYADTKPRYFKSRQDFTDNIDAGSCQLLVMCNTLHEIRPEDWLKYFGKNGAIAQWLHPEGYLLVVEDQVLPFGERAHDYGYLVLDAPDLRMLFGLSKEDGSFVTDRHPEPRYADRLKAHLIPAAAVAAMTPDSIGKALKSLADRAMAQGLALNKKAKDSGGLDHREGRQYAFWTHQHFNATAAHQAMVG